jgi:hypothetical protein
MAALRRDGWRGQSSTQPILADAGAGLGNFDLMANAWGMDDSLLYPPPLSAWSKIKLGWVIPIEISETGYVTIEPASEAKVSEPDFWLAWYWYRLTPRGRRKTNEMP